MNKLIQRLEAQVMTAASPQVRIDAQNALAWELRDLQPAQAASLATEAQQLAQRGEFAQTPYQVGIAHSLTVLSYLHYRESNYAESLAQAIAAIDLLENAQAPAWLPKLYNTLSLNHTALGNRAETVDNLLKQLALSQQLGDENMEGTAYHDLALAYCALGDYEQALAYLAKAKVLFTRTDDPVGDVFVFFNQADTYLRMGEYVQAEASAQVGLAAAQACGYHHGQILSLMTLGDISQAAQQLAEAFHYYEQALALAQQASIDELQGSMQEKLGEVSLKQGDHSAALRFAQAALATYENAHSDLLLLGAQRLLAKIYKAQGDYAQALAALEAVQALSERVFNADNERRMRALIVLHRTEAARREAELLREKNAALEDEIAERKRTEQALIHAQKMESLGVLAGGVAHDFNNLLTTMVGQSSLALRRLSTEHPARPHIEKALQSMERGADLVRQILAYSGKGSFAVTDCRLNEIIRENLPLLDSVTQNTLAFQLDLAPVLPMIKADQSQLYQILVNLILNAYEAGASQVQIRTTTQRLSEADHQYWQYTSQSLLPGNYVLLQIVDNGHGMSELTLQKLFDPFYTTKFTGRGLGLAAVLGIVRGHAGGICVESQLHHGTTITIVLPPL